MINITQADAYFKNHARADHWAQFSASQRAGAIQQAMRDFARELRRPMKEDEPPYVPGDDKRDEYAVYEQALHALLQMGQGKAKGPSLPSLHGNDGEREMPPAGKWAQEALRWLGCRTGAVTLRG
jgi:hypothetical protein